VSGEWRSDPLARFEYRWWDGDRYTEWVARDGEQLEDPAGIPDVPATIETGFGPDRAQNRWTVAFRIVLAIPHLVWITLVTIGAVFVVIAGWFVALFTGRLPDDMARFLTHYLMRDDYPPFDLADDRYPVAVAVPPGERLNRWAVLFRIVLALPVLVVVNWLGSGVALALLVLWVVVLVQGRMPGMSAQALGAVLRFQTRVWGYVMLLTPQYPRALYGDGPPVTEDGPAVPERPGPLALGVGAKRLVTVFLVLGLVQAVTDNVMNPPTEPGARAAVPAAVVPTVPEPRAADPSAQVPDARSLASSASSVAADRS
jgi:hypothetical protein